jgi:predicted hydrocarbon binding protein
LWGDTVPEEIMADNLIMRVFLETIENIIGPNGLKSILNYARLEKYIGQLPPDNDEKEIPMQDLHRLYLSLHEMFGNRGARSLQLRVGRENVYRGLQKRPGIARTMQLASHLVPETTKMRLALERLVKYMRESSSKSSDDFVEIQEKEECFILIQKENIESVGIQSPTPTCGVTLGIIEALVEWMTGHPHEVQEIECRAMGNSADIFRVSKKPKREN